ncbi:AI-2E family transporter [Hyalangium rubrum]|uniref:AI-2E family transporter n=1 Tax=Hyalangium rubrum TaxID=3103134 RepID=A0ABU5GZ10_9BACT|nr:AI-2E family transporter [Hyalangium sp. s54d21]MDY7226291.1 AI-2E family transporter [Hyalangium sp. s54d21]
MAAGGSTNWQRSQVTLKTAFTVGFAALAVVVAAVLVVKTRVALTLTGIAALLALSLEHGVARLVRAGLRRGLAILVVMGTVVVLMAGLGLLVIPAAITQGEALLTQFPTLLEQIRSLRLFRLLSAHFDTLAQLGQENPAARSSGMLAMPPLLRAIGGAVSLAGAALTVFFLVVFMLVFGGGLLRRVLAQVPSEHRARYERVLRKVYDATGGYLSGLTLICSVNATLTTTVLALLGLPFFLPLGIASGFSSMVPYAGPVVAGGFITLLTLVTAGWWQASVVFIYFILYGQLEGNVIAPLVFRRTVHVNPLLTLLAVLFCAELAGIVGAVVAVPVVATVQIIIRELLLLRQERRAAVMP